MTDFPAGGLGQRRWIEITRFGWMLGLGKRWTPGEKLKLLSPAYNGTRNTGSDVRVSGNVAAGPDVLGRSMPISA